MKNVKIKASETKIWFGGICWVPRACLKNEKTIISLTKLVITKISEGAKTKSVRIIKTFRELTKSFGSLGAEIDISIFGTLTLSAPKAVNTKRDRSKKAFKMAIPRFWCYQEYSF